jgi:hypothetical protein
MGLQCWFRDDVRSMLAALAVTVASGDGPLSEYDRGRLAMLASVAVAFDVELPALPGGEFVTRSLVVNGSPRDTKKSEPVSVDRSPVRLSPGDGSIHLKSGLVKGSSCF